MLHIYFLLKNEPLSPKALKQIIDEKQRQQQFWDNFKEVPKTEEELKP